MVVVVAVAKNLGIARKPLYESIVMRKMHVEQVNL